MTPAAWDLAALPGPFAAVGRTPLAPVDIDGVRLWIKLEGLNPTGSVKDRAAAEMIKGKIATGELEPGKIILDASSGNMACALAAYGRALGIEAHVVCNTTATPDKRRMIQHFGATLIENDFGPYTHDGYRKCLSLLERNDSPYCFINQLHNPLNPLAHEIGTGPEVLRDLPDVRLITGSLGSGGTMLGLARAVRGRNVSLAAVSSAPGSRMAGVGAFADGDYRSPFIREAEQSGLYAATPLVTVAEARHWQHVLTDRGLFCGPQTGAVVAGAMRVAGELGLRDGIAVISGEAGWKSWST